MNVLQAALRPLAALMVVVAVAVPVKAQDLGDAEIIAIYSQVNGFDIETALLGNLNGHSEGVRSLGRMVWQDHSGVRKGVHELAAEIGVSPALPPQRIEAARNHDLVMAELMGLDGRDFDAAYLRHEIAFHRAAIEAVRGLLLPAAGDERLRAHFEAVLPAFEHHLAENLRVAGELNIEIAE